jgi:hypothetical protein
LSKDQSVVNALWNSLSNDRTTIDGIWKQYNSIEDEDKRAKLETVANELETALREAETKA